MQQYSMQRAGGGTRTHTPIWTQAPKACASTIPPLRRSKTQKSREGPYCSLQASLSLRTALLILIIVLVPAVNAQDYGRWTFEAPPEDVLGFIPDSTWLENARLGTIQLSGCVSALVSADGLVATSASCIRGAIANSLGDSMATGGFYAATIEDEEPIRPFMAHQVVNMVDITGQDESAFMEDTDWEYHIMTREDSTRFWLYAFKPFRDVRLVLLPAASVADFGNEEGVYPRHSVNFAFLRLYGDAGIPHDTETYYAWTDRSPSPGEMLYATDVPQYTPFLSAGTVEVYPYNGTVTPLYTTFYGMMDLHFAHGTDGSWSLPEQWIMHLKSLELSSPLNFSLTGSCIQYGAPLYSQDLEVLGLIFDKVDDGNSDRCVAMSTGGVLTVLRDIYGADRIVEELEHQQIPAANN